MTIEVTRAPAPDVIQAAPLADRAGLAAVFVRDAVQGLLLRLAAGLRAARKRRRMPGPLDDRVYDDLSQARRELDFAYRNNLDLR